MSDKDLSIHKRKLFFSHYVGNFEEGKEFDALLVDSGVDGGAYDLCDVTNAEELVQKFLYCGDDRNITEVYVAGKKVVSK